MQRLHRTLKRELTKTILIWSGVFFALLVVGFLLSLHQMECYIVGLIADHRLSYQTHTFAKHMDQQDNRSIQEDSKVLTQGGIISAILLIDTSGTLLDVALNKNLDGTLTITRPVSIHSLQNLADATPHLHLYARAIPGHKATLALILNDRPVALAIYSATAWTLLLLLILLLLSIMALHAALRRHLVTPVEQLRQAVQNDNIDDNAVLALEQELPEEASDILEVYDQLKHAHADMRTHIVDMMTALPSCFWWSENGKTYTGASNKCSDIMKSTPEQLSGQAIWSWTGSREQAAVNNRQLQLSLAEKRGQLDLAYQLTTGDSTRWLGENITLSYDKDGQLDAIYGVINDISKRKNNQQQRAEALETTHRLQATATMVGGIAHEFNNALAGMNGNLFLIKQSVKDEQTRMRITRIEQLVERSALMIDHMLAYSRQSIERAGPIDMITFLENFLMTVMPNLPAKIRFNLQLDAVRGGDITIRPVILADEKKMQEVLLQLIDNARLATEQAIAPHIELSLEYLEADDAFLRQHSCLSSRDLIHLSIQDNGSGIPEDIRKRVFEPFFTTREVGQGTGLGLSMAHGYIHQVGGDIAFDSSIEHGTTFHIYLPKITSKPGEAQSDTMLRGNGETILVVDDDKMVRESTCSILMRMGYLAIPARSGEQSVEIFSQRRTEIKLVFMDILMPGINGIEASRRIRKLAPDMPVIFITGYDRTQPLEPEVYAENTELINKPFRFSTLSQSIQQALAGNLGKQQD